VRRGAGVDSAGGSAEKVRGMFRGICCSKYGKREMSVVLIYRWCFTLHIRVGLYKGFLGVFNISLQNVEGKVGPKVFWLFVFGHFFCPFLKRGY